MKHELLICENNKEQGMNLYSSAASYNFDLEIRLFNDSNTLLSYLKNHSSNSIILMDIMLDNGESGIDIVKEIHRLDSKIPVIFISAYLEMACEVYEVKHCYFVYIPQKDEKLKQDISKSMDPINRKPAQLLLHEGQDLLTINIEEILCIERIRRATFITTAAKVYEVQESLKELKEMLPESFVQCHRSYLINFLHVRRLKSSQLELKNGINVPLYRRMTLAVSALFKSGWQAAEMKYYDKFISALFMVFIMSDGGFGFCSFGR